MAMFGFDEQYPIFDVTPVDNQFILEYLPGATGDAVRVYLYGLMQCHHPQTAMTVDQMARELGMTGDEILAAYRHWERKGLVRRIADHPPTFRYVSVQQTMFMGAAVPVDEEYERFASALYAVFGNDRRLHGKEISQCYEWVEEMGLPADVVICLMEHMVAMHGKGVAIKTVEKRAALLAEEKITTVEDARQVLGRDKAVWDGSRAVLRRLGKRRYPSDDEQALYRRWVVEWAFTHDDVLAACAETTKGEPTFAYLDGILRRIHAQRTGDRPARVEKTISEERENIAPLKALLNVMKIRGVSINEGTLAMYEEMRAIYPDPIILMAGRECARHGLALDGVMSTLNIWKREGLQNAAEIETYMRRVNDQNDFLQVLYDIMGVDNVRPNAADRRLVQRWEQEYGYGREFVSECAPWAIGKAKPMLYLDKLLAAMSSRGVRTMEEARAERERFQAAQPQQNGTAPARGPKVVGEQLYTQREYAHSEDDLDEMMRKWQEGKGDA